MATATTLTFVDVKTKNRNERGQNISVPPTS